MYTHVGFTSANGYHLDSPLQWGEAADDGLLWAVKWLRVIFCRIRAQPFWASFFILTCAATELFLRLDRERRRRVRGTTVFVALKRFLGAIQTELDGVH